MGSILNTAISGINAMKTMIEKTTNKINHPNENNNIEKRVFLENTVQDSNLNTAVKVKEIYDNYNDFITEEQRKTNVQVQNEQTKIEQLLKLEELLCKKSNIFNILINDLYEQIENNVLVEKQNVINDKIKEKSNNIINALKDFDKKLTFLEKDIKESIINNVNKVNSLIDKIHDLTIDIRYFPVLKLPNRIQSFIDKRDDLVDELNNIIGIKVVKGDDSYKIYLNNGICIIDNNHKQNLISLTSKSDDRYISVGYINEKEKTVQKIEEMIPSAILGALLKFRGEELKNTRNKISYLTVNFANSINSYHTLEDDVSDHVGKKIFNISNPEVIPSSTNHASPITHARWISPNASKDTDYILYFKNNTWNIKRLSDHTSVQPDIHQENNNLLVTFDGIEFLIQGKNEDGDIYMIKPYSKTLEQLELLINENEPFYFASENNINDQNKTDKVEMIKIHHHNLVDRNRNLDENYQKFSKSISYKCNLLEEELPFKKNMINILRDKKIYMSNNIEQDYQNLNYQQECYLANVKVLKIAEQIFNEIVDCYS